MTYNYTIIFELEDDGSYHVYCPTLQGCHSFGKTIEEAKKNIKEAIEAYIGSLKKDGEEIPVEHDVLVGELKLELAAA